MKTVPLFIAAILASAQLTAGAAVIGVVDSGVDLKHPNLNSKAWVNPGEIPNNMIDDEQDGYVDDIHGWNFVENNPILLDSKYLNTFPPETPRFFEIQKRLLEGTASDEDKAWLKETIENPEFRKKLNIFGNFVHGTHVAGIAARKNDAAEILGIKMIPTESPLAPDAAYGLSDNVKAARRFLANVWNTIWPVLRDTGIKAGLRKLAELQNEQFRKAALYLNDKNTDVANYSLGISTTAAGNLVKPILRVIYGRDATEDEILQYSSYLVARSAEQAEKWVSYAPNTLFVIAAGNDGTNNDELPTSPANAKAANTITVAATLGRTRLAQFSNFGRHMVEVAAPGVGITSEMPGGGELVLSGTSQAAPYVAQVAAAIKDTNPDLEVYDLKRIIIETVDKREWLADKVKSSGIVNRDRAVFAAELATKMSVTQAIKIALREVPDLETPYERVLSAEDESLIWAPELSMGL